MDLIVWIGITGEPTSFQLAYDKYRGEHLVSMGTDKGAKHFSVDDGEQSLSRKHVPTLHANGAIDSLKLLTSFRAEVIKLPAAIREFVEART